MKIAYEVGDKAFCNNGIFSRDLVSIIEVTESGYMVKGKKSFRSSDEDPDKEIESFCNSFHLTPYISDRENVLSLLQREVKEKTNVIDSIKDILL